MWDGGVTLRLGDEFGGYRAEEVVESVFRLFSSIVRTRVVR